MPIADTQERCHSRRSAEQILAELGDDMTVFRRRPTRPPGQASVRATTRVRANASPARPAKATAGSAPPCASWAMSKARISSSNGDPPRASLTGSPGWRASWYSSEWTSSSLSARQPSARARKRQRRFDRYVGKFRSGRGRVRGQPRATRREYHRGPDRAGRHAGSQEAGAAQGGGPGGRADRPSGPRRSQLRESSAGGAEGGVIPRRQAGCRKGSGR